MVGWWWAWARNKRRWPLVDWPTGRLAEGAVDEMLKQEPATGDILDVLDRPSVVNQTWTFAPLLRLLRKTQEQC